MTQRIYESMVRSIISGEFVQGQVLTELTLAEQFDCSRTPIREACIRLHNEGFLRASNRKGYVVTEVSLDEIRELYQLRLMMEPVAAEMAAGAPLGSEFFSTTEKLLEKQHTVSMRQDRTYESFFELGIAEYGFHLAIARASQNKRLAKFMGEVMNQFRRFHYVSFQKVRLSWQEETVDQHREILEAIRIHDGKSARHLMHNHIVNGSEKAFQLVLATISPKQSYLTESQPLFVKSNETTN